MKRRPRLRVLCRIVRQSELRGRALLAAIRGRS
jgi:hypothetical protein